MVLTQIITQVYKILSPWHTHQISIVWLVLQVWYPQIGSLIPLLTLIIDTMHSPIFGPTLIHTPPWTTFHEDDSTKCMAPWLFRISRIVFWMMDKFIKTLFTIIIIISPKLLNEQGIIGFMNIYMNKVGLASGKTSSRVDLCYLDFFLSTLTFL